MPLSRKKDINFYKSLDKFPECKEVWKHFRDFADDRFKNGLEVSMFGIGSCRLVRKTNKQGERIIRCYSYPNYIDMDSPLLEQVGFYLTLNMNNVSSLKKSYKTKKHKILDHEYAKEFNPISGVRLDSIRHGWFYQKLQVYRLIRGLGKRS